MFFFLLVEDIIRSSPFLVLALLLINLFVSASSILELAYNALTKSVLELVRTTLAPIFSKEEFYKLKYCSTVVYMVPRA